MEIGARIAAAQLAGSARSKRQVIAGPLVGLLDDDETWYLSGMLAAEPGEPFDPGEISWALDTIRQAFAAEGRWLSAELVVEANPGLAEALESDGMTIVSRPPLLVVEPAELKNPELPAGVTVEVVKSDAQQAEANLVFAKAFEFEGAGLAFQPDPANGGWILVRVDGVPVATGSWTAVAHGVAEVAGVGTIHSHRRRGLGGAHDPAGLRARRRHTRVAHPGRRRRGPRVPPPRVRSQGDRRPPRGPGRSPRRPALSDRQQPEAGHDQRTSATRQPLPTARTSDRVSAWISPAR
jgi:hypothetical protein